MKKFFRWTSLVLALLLVFSAVGCSVKKPSGKGNPEDTDDGKFRIGVLVPDSANADGLSYHHLDGIRKAAASLSIPEEQILIKYSVTDVSFDASKKLKAKRYEAPETTAAPEEEPESYTEADGKVVIVPAPILPPVHETAPEAVADLLSSHCNLIIATNEMYNAFISYAAKQFPDVYFMQYNGSDTETANLKSYSVKTEEAFYLAGALAASTGCEKLGFVAGRKDKANTSYINAFALGAETVSASATVTARFTNADLDLVLEQTVPLSLIEKDGCDLICQSVFTALPQTIAANDSGEYEHKSIRCIGHSFDMHKDGGKKNLCSVLYNFEVCFTPAIKSAMDGSFTNTPYSGGLKDGAVLLSKLYTKNQNTLDVYDTLMEKFNSDSVKVFDGFTPEKNGFASNVIVK